jgi:hypothetical protein
MEGHREFTEMERLMNALAPRLESSVDLQSMFHNYKGSKDVVASMEAMINNLLDYKEAAEKDQAERAQIEADLNSNKYDNRYAAQLHRRLPEHIAPTDGTWLQCLKAVTTLKDMWSMARMDVDHLESVLEEAGQRPE